MSFLVYTDRIQRIRFKVSIMSCVNPAVPLSVRISVEARDRLEELSATTGRTKSFLAAEAIENYVEVQSWQVKGIESSIKKADSKNAHFVDHNDVNAYSTSNRPFNFATCVNLFSAKKV